MEFKFTYYQWFPFKIYSILAFFIRTILFVIGTNFEALKDLKSNKNVGLNIAYMRYEGWLDSRYLQVQRFSI